MNKPALRRLKTCRLPPACSLIGVVIKRRRSGNSECDGGADRDRTGDLMLAKHALSQLSYSPTEKLSAFSRQINC